MCRIAGIAFDSRYFSSIDAMTDFLAHGGPDDRGIWHDDYVAFGHRRLAIIDLSPLGHQPMLSASGRYVIIFNGEIYNFKILRAELEAKTYQFKGHSDTEVVLAAIEAWGFAKTLEKLNGMFAIALWDRQEKKLYLARDRFGEKPLYYGIVNGALIFASELKAICLYPGFQKRINQEALQLLLRYAYIQAPYSIYEGIYKLESGHYLVVDDKLKLQKHCYWSAVEAALQARRCEIKLSFQEAVDELEGQLIESIRNRCISDVPLGAFLSGGIDSSIIVALMQKLSNKPVQTFSIGFDQKEYNEAPFAKAVAEHLQTDHHEFYVSEQDALDVIPKLATIYDEPFADSSQIPTYLISSLAKKRVTVVLTGDAGDEIFGGYGRYFTAQRFKALYSLPPLLRRTGAKFIRHFPWQCLGQNVHRANKLAWILENADKSNSLYQSLISQNYEAELYLSHEQLKSIDFEAYQGLTDTEHMMLWDTISYLPGDILTKVDRASMAVALETRIPFLDHKIFEFAWSLPADYKVREGSGKRLLKALLARYVPKQLVDRPKVGFGIPIHHWLRGPLREWGEDLIADMQNQDIINVQMVKKAWSKHFAGEDTGYLLWNILMFQEWANQNLKN
ncbi:MAG: asparagine synthetase [Gammaproteobacteria bacterium]|jgi:asparagine synthase (glutamine-hydrolysing)|nr:asparagine synthetase [Gammaproteobacteria bacterium]